MEHRESSAEHTKRATRRSLALAARKRAPPQPTKSTGRWKRRAVTTTMTDEPVSPTSAPSYPDPEIAAFVSRLEEASHLDPLSLNAPLSETLRGGFVEPFVLRPAPEDANGPKTTISRLVQHLAGQKNLRLSVYDYTIPDEGKRTYRVPATELLNQFPSDTTNAPLPADVPLNFLDIPNKSDIVFTPPEILQSGLLGGEEAIAAISCAQQPSKAPSPSTKEFFREWFVLSKQMAISTIHVDKAGSCTWIKILEGEKDWYLLRRPCARDLRHLYQVSNHAVDGYSSEWIKVRLLPGDIMIMPPGTPHAVVTRTPCLAVGGNFYLASTFAASLEALRVLEDFPAISNEDMEPTDYAHLAALFHTAHATLPPAFLPAVLANCALFWIPDRDKEFLSPFQRGVYRARSKHDLVQEAAARGLLGDVEGDNGSVAKVDLIVLLSGDDYRRKHGEDGAKAMAAPLRRLYPPTAPSERFLGALQEFVREAWRRRGVAQ